MSSTSTSTRSERCPRKAALLLAIAGMAALGALVPGCGGTSSYSSSPYPANTGTFLFPTAAPVVPDRARHTATLLDNGDVLIAGGTSVTVASPVAQAEVYQPGARNFAVTNGQLNRPRACHSATRLPNDTVLIAGGEDANGVMGDAELFDRLSGQFTLATGPTMTARKFHSATAMEDGSVLIAGGDVNGTPIASVQRYVQGVGFGNVGNLAQARSRHVALRRDNGDIVVAGGFTQAGLTVPTATVEILDQVTGIPRAAQGNLSQPRAGAGATFLTNGLMLIAGGFGVGNVALGTAEIYDPINERTRGALILTRVRGSARVSPLYDGRVLVVGDDNTADIYDPFTSDFVKSASDLVFPRNNGHTLTPLGTAEVLVFGGTVISPAASGAAELFDPR